MITFENYTIRPLHIDDLNPYFDLVQRNRKRLEDFFTGTVSRTKDLESTKAFLLEIDEKRKNKEYYPYLVVDNLTHSFVAFIDLKNVDWSIPKTEIGFYADEKSAGKGITTKAINLLIDFCFENFNFKKIYLRTHESNKAALSVAKKCGFELEGTIRMDYVTTAGEIVDLMYFGRLK